MPRCGHTALQILLVHVQQNDLFGFKRLGRGPGNRCICWVSPWSFYRKCAQTCILHIMSCLCHHTSTQKDIKPFIYWNALRRLKYICWTWTQSGNAQQHLNQLYLNTPTCSFLNLHLWVWCRHRTGKPLVFPTTRTSNFFWLHQLVQKDGGYQFPQEIS